MPTSASAPIRQPCSTAPWPMWPLRSTTVSPSGNRASRRCPADWRPPPGRSAEVATQARQRADVAMGTDDHVTDQHGRRMHIGTGSTTGSGHQGCSRSWQVPSQSDANNGYFVSHRFYQHKD
jgi:hypothetical protein